jgi:hypothetical protein
MNATRLDQGDITHKEQESMARQKWDGRPAISREYFTPVAVWRGVAIFERRGDKRSVWKGKEYRTDGKVYLWHAVDEKYDGQMAVLANEEEVKNLLDLMTEEELKQFVTWKVATKMLTGKEPQATPRYRFDDVSKLFVPE